MELIAFVLFMTAKILITVIWVFLMAVPTGIGLGIGLHYAKKFLSWRGRKNPTAAQRAENYQDFSEIAAAGAAAAQHI